MSRRLSTSVTFQNLQSRVAALEEQGLLASNVVTALGYVPANKAGDTFAGNVTVSGNITVPNSTYIKSALTSGAVTRLFGLNGSNSLYIGGIDATIASVVIEVASTPVQTISTIGVAITGTLSVSGNVTMGGALIATQAYVGTQIANLVGSAPSTLDTLNELAASLANDANFSTTMTNALAGKAPLAGAAFTGPVSFGDAAFYTDYNYGISPNIQYDSDDYAGYQRAANKFYWVIANSSQATLDLSGFQCLGYVRSGDSNFGLNFNAGTQPFLAFDNGDNLNFVRSSNTLGFNIANSTVLSVGPTGNINTGGNISGSAFFVDPSFTLTLSSSNPRLTFDANDYLQYDRTANRYNMVVGGAAQFVLDSGGATVVGTELIVANDSNFRLSMASSTQPLLRFDSGDQYLYDRAANQHKMMIGGAIKLVVDTNGLTSNGAVAAGTYVQIGDLNFFAQIASGNPQISFDSGDQLFYDRTANKFYFAIGGVNVASIDASGNMRIKGALTQGVTP